MHSKKHVEEDTRKLTLVVIFMSIVVFVLYVLVPLH